jgi:hypothetical protein
MRNGLNQHYVNAYIHNNSDALREAKDLRESYIDKLKKELAREEELAPKFNDDLCQETGSEISNNKKEDKQKIEDKKVPGKIGNRKSSKLFNYLVLQVLNISNKKQPVDLDDIYNVAVVFDPLTKRESLNSTLNRWKNSKRWVSWSTTDFRQITKEGMDELNRLIPFVEKDPEGLKKVKRAIKGVLGTEL